MVNFDPDWLMQARAEVKAVFKQDIKCFDYFRDVGNYSSFIDSVNIVNQSWDPDGTLEKIICSQETCHYFINYTLRKNAQSEKKNDKINNIATSIYLSEEYLKRHPDDAIWYAVMADIYFQWPSPKEVALGFNLLKKSIDMAPRNYRIYEKILKNFEKLDMIEDALDFLGKIGEKYPKNPFPPFYIGWIYQTRLSDNLKAVEEYKKAMWADLSFVAAQQAIEQILHPQRINLI